jgi:hypothetical protein
MRKNPQTLNVFFKTKILFTINKISTTNSKLQKTNVLHQILNIYSQLRIIIWLEIHGAWIIDEHGYAINIQNNQIQHPYAKSFMRWECLVFLYRPFYKDQVFLHHREGFLEMPDSFFVFFHLFLFLCGPLIISEGLHQPWVLNTCSTKVLLHFFSHCCPFPFGPRNYAHSWTRNIGH